MLFANLIREVFLMSRLVVLVFHSFPRYHKFPPFLLRKLQLFSLGKTKKENFQFQMFNNHNLREKNSYVLMILSIFCLDVNFSVNLNPNHSPLAKTLLKGFILWGLQVILLFLHPSIPTNILDQEKQP